MKGVSLNTKWFNIMTAKYIQRELLVRGIKTKIVKTMKTNPLTKEKARAWLIKEI